MKYTFEITICGCSTNCAHCYVDGGAAPQIKLSDYELFLEKLKPVLDRVEGDISVTLGNEIFCHRSIAELLNITADKIPEYYTYEGGTVPTTGIALLANKEREEILEILKKVDSKGFMLAVHGAAQTHDGIVQRKDAFSKLFEAALFSTPEFGFSNTHFSHVQAGQMSRQALQRMQRDSSFCQNANLSSAVMFSSFSTSSKRPESITSPSSPISSS